MKDGTTWYVWSNSLGQYVPQTLAPESLGYWIGPDAPDPLVFSVWIQTAVGGSPLAIKTFYSGSWVDVYAAVLASYLTITAFNAAIANYSTTAAMNAAIASAVAGVSFASYPAQAELTSGPQGISLGAAPVQCTLNLAPINPSPAPFNIILSRYVAPADGVYSAGVNAIFQNNTGTPSGMNVIIRLYKNGVDQGVYSANGTATPNGGDWWVAIPPILIQLVANDYLEFFTEASDGVDTGILNLVNIDASFFRVSA